MIYSSSPTITDLIISTLQRGPKRIVFLIQEIQQQRPQSTKQGIYAALRKLKKEEKIVVHKKNASLNSAWVAQMNTFFSTAQAHTHSMQSHDGNFLALEDGSKISYSFKDPIATDAFWGHAFRILTELMPTESPIFLYNPHQFFLLARKEQENTLINYIIEHQCYYLLTVGGNTILDKSISTEFDGTYKQYTMLSKPLYKKNTYYFNIFGDYIIEVWIGQKTAYLIEKLYQSTEVCTPHTIQELKNIMKLQEKTKLTISKNKRKANKMKKSLRKFFYIPK